LKNLYREVGHLEKQYNNIEEFDSEESIEEREEKK
jgi:hypothetical protein